MTKDKGKSDKKYSLIKGIAFFFLLFFLQKLIDKIPEYKFTHYVEERDTFNADLDYILNQWESFNYDWSAQWTVDPSKVEESIWELDHYERSEIVPDLDKKMPNHQRRTYILGAFQQHVLKDNEERLDNIVNAFVWYKEKNRLSTRETAELIIGMIQNIPYEVPEERRMGISPPLEVLAERKGDCDSKTILAALILDRMGYKCLILSSIYYHHSMLGLNLPSTGEYKTWNYENYYFVEMTHPGWMIGQISTDLDDLDKWFIIPLITESFQS